MGNGVRRRMNRRRFHPQKLTTPSRNGNREDAPAPPGGAGVPSFPPPDLRSGGTSSASPKLLKSVWGTLPETRPLLRRSQRRPLPPMSRNPTSCATTHQIRPTPPQVHPRHRSKLQSFAPRDAPILFVLHGRCPRSRTLRFSQSNPRSGRVWMAAGTERSRQRGVVGCFPDLFRAGDAAGSPDVVPPLGQLRTDIEWFPLVGATTVLIFLDPDWPERCLKWVRNPARPAPAPAGPTWPTPRWILVLCSAWLGWQAIMPLRHWLIPGDARITFEGLSFSWRLKAELYQSIHATIVVQDPAVLATLNGSTRIDWQQWPDEKVLRREVIPGQIPWVDLAPIVAVADPEFGERILFNPVSAEAPRGDRKRGADRGDPAVDRAPRTSAVGTAPGGVGRSDCRCLHGSRPIPGTAAHGSGTGRRHADPGTRSYGERSDAPVPPPYPAVSHQPQRRLFRSVPVAGRPGRLADPFEAASPDRSHRLADRTSESRSGRPPPE